MIYSVYKVVISDPRYVPYIYAHCGYQLDPYYNKIKTKILCHHTHRDSSSWNHEKAMQCKYHITKMLKFIITIDHEHSTLRTI